MLAAASLQKRGIITVFMSQTHSPAPVRKLKKYFPHVTLQREAHCSHAVAGVHSFDKMTIAEALKAIVIMKNND